MRATLLIAWREYRQYIFSRGFLLFLVMFPLGVVFIGAAMGFLERSKPAREFIVFDGTGRYAEVIDEEIERRRRRAVLSAWDAYLAVSTDRAALDAGAMPAPFAPEEAGGSARLDAFHAAGLDEARAAAAPYLRQGAPAFTPPRAPFRRLETPAAIAGAGSAEEAVELVRPYLLDRRRVAGAEGPLFAAIVIPEGFGAGEGAASAQFWSRNLTDPSLESAVSNALDYALQREAVSAYGLPAGALEEISAITAPLTAFRPDRAAGEEAELSVRDRIETALPAAMTYMLLVIIFGVGNLLLTNTIEERSNKIVEVLLSSVTADQLMMGKLIGIAAVGLTMPTIFLIGGLVASLAGGGGEWAGHAMSALFGSNLIAVYLFYFLAAYMIFAMIFLAIGAVSNSLQDAQSYMGPVMLLVFLPLPFMIMVYQNPNGLIASILTWIPIYTPYAVMMRAASDPPLWEIVGATALMLAFAIVLVRVMGRIFRAAILQSAPPKAKDVWRLARGEGE